MRYWLIADGDDGDQWDEFYHDAVVRITGRQKLGDLQQYASVHELAQALREKYREEFETKKRVIKARLCFNFGHEVMVGDALFVRHRRKMLLGYGIAEAPPGRPSNPPSTTAYFFDKHHPRYPHAIKVRWLKKGEFPVRNFLLPMNFIAPMDGDRLTAVRKAMGLANGPSNRGTQRGNGDGAIYPDELVSGQSYCEGAVATVQVNRYERDPQARKACLAKKGERCIVCDLSFDERYGDIGRGFIHVHHLKPVAMMRRRYKINPETDLVPVCPNCHAMLHRAGPPLSIAQLKAKLQPS